MRARTTFTLCQNFQNLSDTSVQQYSKESHGPRRCKVPPIVTHVLYNDNCRAYNCRHDIWRMFLFVFYCSCVKRAIVSKLKDHAVAARGYLRHGTDSSLLITRFIVSITQTSEIILLPLVRFRLDADLRLHRQHSYTQVSFTINVSIRCICLYVVVSA